MVADATDTVADAADTDADAADTAAGATGRLPPARVAAWQGTRRRDNAQRIACFQTLWFDDFFMP